MPCPSEIVPGVSAVHRPTMGITGFCTDARRRACPNGTTAGGFTTTSHASDLTTAAMRIEDVRSKPFAQVHLGIQRIGAHFELDDVELKAVERAAHVVVAI